MQLSSPSRSRTCADWVFIALLVSIGSLCGCGNSSNAVAHLAGNVTLDGKPLPKDASASVTFRPVGESGQPVSTPITEGRYDCSNVPKGAVLALVNISIPTGRTLQGDLRTGESGREFESVVLSPDQASGIKVEVTEDANIDFELIRDKK